MGCFDWCAEFNENYIRHNRPVQIALAVVFGILFITIVLAIGGVFKSPTCSTCSSCFYYEFTLSSQQTACKLKTEKQVCADLPLRNLSIHGLWPEITEKQALLIQCRDNKNQFDPNMISDTTQKTMTHRWPTAFTKDAAGTAVNNTSFWKHEWEKHGTCSPHSVKVYFDKAIDLDSHYPVIDWLAKSKILPNNSRAYSAGDFKLALTKHIDESQYFLRCVKVPNSKKEDVWWLTELILCVSYRDTRSLIQCPYLPEATCKDKFYYVNDYKQDITN